MKHGKPQKQALAIAYSTKRANMANGGMMKKNDQSKEVHPGGKSSGRNAPGSMSRNDQSPETYYRGGMTNDSREQHNSDCPDCMAEGGMCMSHGGMAQPAGGEPSSHRPTQDLYPHRPNHAEGGMVDALRPKLPSLQKAMDQYQGADDGPVSHRPTRDQYAEGGEVDEMRSMHTDPMREGNEANEDLHPDREADKMPLVLEGMDSEEASDLERDMPRKSEDLSLAGEIMLDRKRRQLAMGGSVKSYEDGSDSSKVGSLHGSIDEPTNSNMDNDADEHDAPEQDGRYQRGLNLEPVHSMDDERHDVSEASLVAEILRDRKRRRRE